MASKRQEKRKLPQPSAERTESRAASLAREGIPPTEAQRAARTLLAESDARTKRDPAPRDLRDDTVERRNSDLATPPPDLPS